MCPLPYLGCYKVSPFVQGIGMQDAMSVDNTIFCMSSNREDDQVFVGRKGKCISSV